MQQPPDPNQQYAQQWQQLQPEQQQLPLPPQQQWQQQPYSPPPFQPPEKPRSAFKLGLGIGCGIMAAFAIGLVVLAVLASAGRQNSTVQQQVGTQPASQPTQATPTPIPTIAPISLSGVGQQASNKFQLQQGLAIFKLTHDGTSNFIVNLLDSNGQAIDLLVNEIGSFNGSKAEGIQNAGTYVLDIQADGKWTVTIQQPRPTTAPYTTSFSGKGQAATKLFSMKSGLKIIQMTHDGTSNFIVNLLDSNGQAIDLLVNEIGKFSGSKAEGIPNDGIYLFDIQADGNWTITIR